MRKHRLKNIQNYQIKPINPLICGNEACLPGHDYGPAVRHYWLLHFVVSGKGFFQTDQNRYSLSAGDLFVIRPFEVTYYQADQTFPWEYFWIGFTSEAPLPEILTRCDVIHLPQLEPFFREAMEADVFSLTEAGSSYAYYLCGILWQIFAHLILRGEKKSLNSDHYVKSAISMIESEYATSLTVIDLAERLHLNRSYFSQIFKERTGVSPHRYLSDCRMRHARQLLEKGGYPVNVTALSVGYPDVFSFSRAYKQYFGFSPSESRKKNAATAQNEGKSEQ